MRMMTTKAMMTMTKVCFRTHPWRYITSKAASKCTHRRRVTLWTLLLELSYEIQNTRSCNTPHVASDFPHTNSYTVFKGLYMPSCTTTECAVQARSFVMILLLNMLFVRSEDAASVDCDRFSSALSRKTPPNDLHTYEMFIHQLCNLWSAFSQRTYQHA